MSQNKCSKNCNRNVYRIKDGVKNRLDQQTKLYIIFSYGSRQ